MKSQTRAIQSVSDIKDYIKAETESDPKKWITLSMNIVQERFDLPQYLSRSVISILSLDPELRYQLVEATARFKPKKFRFDLPEEKLKDLGKIRQFQMSELEEKTLLKRLNKYYNIDQIQVIYILMHICEKLIIKKVHKEWNTINIPEFSRSIGISDIETYHYIDILYSEGILKKSPINNMYKLTITEEDSKIVDKDIEAIILENGGDLEGEMDLSLLSDNANSFTELQELNKFQANLNNMVKHNNKISELIMSQLKLCDTLATKDKMLRQQKNAFIRLNDSYNEQTHRLEKLQEENDKLKQNNKTINKFNDERTRHIEETTNILASELLTIVEEYLKLPVHKKNEIATSAKFKYDINKTIMENTKNIIDFKPYREE